MRNALERYLLGIALLSSLIPLGVWTTTFFGTPVQKKPPYPSGT